MTSTIENVVMHPSNVPLKARSNSFIIWWFTAILVISLSSVISLVMITFAVLLWLLRFLCGHAQLDWEKASKLQRLLRQHFRIHLASLKNMWINSIMCIFSLAMGGDNFASGVPFVLTSENVPCNKKIDITNLDSLVDLLSRKSGSYVLIANHQLYLDWLYIWWFLSRFNRAGDIAIILKDSVKWVPIFGWGAYLFDFIFLKRKWSVDETYMLMKLNRLRTDAQPFILLLFPEGTTMCEITQTSCLKYAQKANLAMPRHVLLPKSTGLFAARNALGASVNGILDFTVGYSGTKADVDAESVFPANDVIIEGHVPYPVHFHVRFFPSEEIPEDQEAFRVWLNDVFYHKNELMDYFFKNGTFPGAVLESGNLKLRKSFSMMKYSAYLLITAILIRWYFQ